MPDFPPDAYFKKEVTLTHNNRTLRFRTSDALFSSHDIDDGTRLLLKTLTPDILEGRRKILDVGCGYGPLGIALAAAGAREVHMVDRDALAVSYSQQNAALNDIDNVHARGSLGYDDVTEREFDLIVSNIPAKAGAPVINHLLRDARHHLAPGGLMAVVVIAPIAAEVESVLRGDPRVDVVFERKAPGYAAFHYRFTGRMGERDERPGFARGIYGDRPWNYELGERIAGAHLNVMDMTGEIRRESAIVLNPTGWPLELLADESLTLIGRDLLSIRQEQWRLWRDDEPPNTILLEHAVGVPAGPRVELIVAVLIEDEGRAAHEEQLAALAERLAARGAMIVSGSSTAITRVERSLKSNNLVRVEDRKRKRGDSVLILSSKR